MFKSPEDIITYVLLFTGNDVDIFIVDATVQCCFYRCPCSQKTFWLILVDDFFLFVETSLFLFLVVILADTSIFVRDVPLY